MAEFTPKQLASLDQALAGMVELARHTAAVYRQFIDSGLDEGKALYLTTKMMEALISGGQPKS